MRKQLTKREARRLMFARRRFLALLSSVINHDVGYLMGSLKALAMAARDVEPRLRIGFENDYRLALKIWRRLIRMDRRLATPEKYRRPVAAAVGGSAG